MSRTVPTSPPARPAADRFWADAEVVLAPEDPRPGRLGRRPVRAARGRHLVAGLPAAPPGRRGARVRQRGGPLGRRRRTSPRWWSSARTPSAPSRWSGPRWCTPPTAGGGSTSAAPRRAPSTGGSTCWRPTPSRAWRRRPRAPCCPAATTAAVKDPVIRHDGEQWHLWASVHPLDDPDATDRMTTEHATSPDGVDWTWRGTALAGTDGQLGRARGPLRHRRPGRLPHLGALRRPGDRGGELGGAHRPGRGRRGAGSPRSATRPCCRALTRPSACATATSSPLPGRRGPLVLRGDPRATAPTSCAPSCCPPEPAASGRDTESLLIDRLDRDTAALVPCRRG